MHIAPQCSYFELLCISGSPCSLSAWLTAAKNLLSHACSSSDVSHCNSTLNVSKVMPLVERLDAVRESQLVNTCATSDAMPLRIGGNAQVDVSFRICILWELLHATAFLVYSLKCPVSRSSVHLFAKRIKQLGHLRNAWILILTCGPGCINVTQVTLTESCIKVLSAQYCMPRDNL